ncbi:Uu.00g033880.m01.CDS01 [Anthostomella pinea]|uniref:Uu.00g033880.m01.CDS01 n=1 Tax=Anthostomella pinea TaxID=933095 RepID=A0AAI8YDA2_9PEZI|nr:Uu.00g033880.m01.CDS01 [Anthostomella pinea]
MVNLPNHSQLYGHRSLQQRSDYRIYSLTSPASHMAGEADTRVPALALGRRRTTVDALATNGAALQQQANPTNTQTDSLLRMGTELNVPTHRWGSILYRDPFGFPDRVLLTGWVPDLLAVPNPGRFGATSVPGSGPHPPQHPPDEARFAPPDTVTSDIAAHTGQQSIEGETATEPIDSGARESQEHRPQVSTNYRGDPNIIANHSADITDDENTSVYITNPPATCTIGVLFASIRNVGKIYAPNMNPPNEEHHRAAAKVVFWTRESAHKLRSSWLRGLWKVEGSLSTLRPNRTKVASQAPSRATRVVRLDGPPEVVNE